MPRPLAFLLADSCVVDMFTQRISVMNLVDVLFVTGFPARTQASAVVQYATEGAPADLFERVQVLAPEGTPLAESRARLKLPARVPGVGPTTHTSIHFVAGIVVQAPGDYLAVLEHAPAEDGPWHRVAARGVVVRPAPVQSPPRAMPQA